MDEIEELFEDNLKKATLIEIASGISDAQYEMCPVYVYEEEAKRFASQSGHAYAGKQDEEAKFYRRLADEYEVKAKKMRVEKHQPAHQRQMKLFAELERREKENA